jgi:hypothetical protein
MAETRLDRVKRLDDEYVEETARVIIEAYQRDRKLPDFNRVHRTAKLYARDVLKFSDRGAQAWASLKCEDVRRSLAAQIANVQR